MQIFLFSLFESSKSIKKKKNVEIIKLHLYTMIKLKNV